MRRETTHIFESCKTWRSGVPRHHPFILYPAFYQVKEFIEGGTPSEGVAKTVVVAGEGQVGPVG